MCKSACNGFSFESINVEFEKTFDIEKVRDILRNQRCKVLDERKNGGYITPLEAENSYMTFISRIRKDSSMIKLLICGSFLIIYSKGQH